MPRLLFCKVVIVSGITAPLNLKSLKSFESKEEATRSTSHRTPFKHQFTSPDQATANFFKPGDPQPMAGGRWGQPDCWLYYAFWRFFTLQKKKYNGISKTKGIIQIVDVTSLCKYMKALILLGAHNTVINRAHPQNFICIKEMHTSGLALVENDYLCICSHGKRPLCALVSMAIKGTAPYMLHIYNINIFLKVTAWSNYWGDWQCGRRGAVEAMFLCLRKVFNQPQWPGELSTQCETTGKSQQRIVCRKKIW